MSNHVRGKIKNDTPLVKIDAVGRRRKSRLDVIVDTGCSCDIVMSRRKAKDLGLQVFCTSHATGAFDNEEPTTVFMGYVGRWFGLSRIVFVHAPENCPTPLIGMGLLGEKTISFQKDCKGKDVHIVLAAECQRAACICTSCPIR